jgi:hypothetical protein
MSGLTGKFLTRDPIGYLGNKNIYFFAASLSRLDPVGLFDTVPSQQTNPFPGTNGPDKDGCFTMSLDDFVNLVKSGHTGPSSIGYFLHIRRGCVGIVGCAQYGGTCSTGGPKIGEQYPEAMPNTRCAKAEKSGGGIPKSISDFKCKEGEEPVIFAKQGVSGPEGKCWPLGDDGFYVPSPWPWPVEGDYPPVLPHPIDPTPTTPGVPSTDPGNGMFNYILYMNGWYIWVNQGQVGTTGRSTVSICPSPLDSPDYPQTMWCVTCKEKCKKGKSQNPTIPSPSPR